MPMRILPINLIHSLRRYLVTAVILIHLFASNALASDQGLRPIWDEVMLWVNFFILVFFIVKFGKRPFVNFIIGQKEEISDEIQRLQKQKTAIEAKIKKTQSMVDESSIRFDQIKARIIEDGEKARQKIIDNAKEQSKTIIELEKLKASTQVTNAKDLFLSEMVDEATALALKRLPSLITDQDHQKYRDLFLSNLSQTSEK